MNCLVRVNSAINIVQKQGGHTVTHSSILTCDEFDKIKSSLPGNVKIETNTLYLHDLFNNDKQIKKTFVEKLSKEPYHQVMTMVLRFGNLSDMSGNTLAHYLIDNGFVFTANDLIRINNPSNRNGYTVSHWMVETGHKFTVPELIKLGNPSADGGISLAHRMIDGGHRFTTEELIDLGNPADGAGDTLAHYMAKNGYKFTEDDILKLKNPSNEKKEFISDFMVRFDL